MNYKAIKKFCCEPLDKIENWDKAIADRTQIWDCHHRLEIEKGMTKQQLIDSDLYFNRPASELIMLTHAQHATLHSKFDNKTKKMNTAWKGQHHTNKTKMRIKKAHIGMKATFEARQKMSKAAKGRKWWNNGIVNKCVKECPGPKWKKGRLCKWRN